MMLRVEADPALPLGLGKRLRRTTVAAGETCEAHLCAHRRGVLVVAEQ
jgi:hypothetical protein